MKTITIIYLCVALLLTIVLSGVRPQSIDGVLNEVANKGTIINGIFKPSKKGKLGRSNFGTVHKGYLHPNNDRKMKVAMKFLPFDAIENSKKEYAMYSYLGAINNKKVEDFGIPTIYYYGKWVEYNYTMLAMTLLDTTFRKKFHDRKMNGLDFLITFRESVKALKYIHSKGIIHHDVGMDNMALQKGHGFIFDFRSATNFCSRRKQNIADAKEDFRYLLIDLFTYSHGSPVFRYLELRESDECHMNKTLFAAKIEEVAKKNGKSLTGAGRAFVELHKHAHDKHSTGTADTNGNSTPFYDQLYGIAIEELKTFGKKGISSITSLSDIPDPFGEHVNHEPRPNVQYDSFEKDPYFVEQKKKYTEASTSSGIGLKSICGRR